MARKQTRWAAFALCAATMTAGVSAAEAQVAATAPDGGPSLVNPGPKASPARKAQYKANRARRRTIREARSAAGANSAAASSIVQGVTASAPSLPPGALDLGNGITLMLNYTGEFAANPSGGRRQGSAYAGQVFFGLDADLGRLAGIEGGSVHTIVTQRHGRSLAQDDIGNTTSVQEIYGGGQTAHLSLLSYEQKLFDNRLDIEAGRLLATVNFLGSPLYCNFQNNGLCGNPKGAFKMTNITWWPIATWGAHAKAWLTDKVFVHAGVYEVNPRDQQDNQNGIDWSTRGATGVVVPIEAGYSTNFGNDPLPRNYSVGAIIDQSDYTDPVQDVGRGAYLLSGLDPLTRFGRSAVFARFDQMVWRPDPTGVQGLSLFGVAMAGTGGRQFEDYFFNGGAVLTGPFPGRPYDTLGVSFALEHFSPIGLANIRAARAKVGLGYGGVSSTQTILELSYGIQLTPAVRLMPNLQYVINPQLQERYFAQPKRVPDAFVVGAKLSVDLFTLAGLAKGPGSL
ncbi:carbohydrate porin [Methylobacterium sp. E-005]|uniref:carbohydrate porin n=1 Tax=Methylobacterium sp. E-005 TaxID=2836549 RepID=UPI001FB8C9F8|nr:carbohydrate porin [Methylobacterium sp. E-005]MCJ2087970.1 carbohydrate porin [Methylobacterium sp. E-005]